MTKRRSIAAPDIPAHQNPIPAASKVGKLLFSSAIGGEDPETHELPEDVETQIANAFRTVRAIMREGGGTPGDIGKVSVYLADKRNREFVNPHWLEMFPDENSRPARHTTEASLPPGRLVQLEIIALIDGEDA